jgi:hypothetical protein
MQGEYLIAKDLQSVVDYYTKHIGEPRVESIKRIAGGVNILLKEETK